MSKKNDRSVPRPSFFWWYFFLVPVLFFLTRFYRVRYVLPKELKKLKGPIVLIGNHVGFWDPFFTAYPLKQKIQFVTSDNIFRAPVFRFFMKVAGSIAKTKFMSDRESLRNIFAVNRMGGSIGIFPEGRRTWDGASIKLIEPVAKLIKKLRVPVVVAKIKGGYLSKPRWAISKRTGPIQIEYKLLFTKEELAKTPTEELFLEMSNAISHQELKSVSTDPDFVFKGKDLAQNLEQLLFLCPSCNSVGNLVSSGDIFSCKKCETVFEIDAKCRLQVKNGENALAKSFADIQDWNRYQVEWLKLKLKTMKKGEKVFDDYGAQLLTGYRRNNLKLISNGVCELFTDRFVFTTSHDKSRSLVFPIDKIKGINIQNKEEMEFYHDNVLYRVSFESPRANSYKYLRAVKFLQDS